MGKRSNFERRERDFYPTPSTAIAPLLPHLPDLFTYIEPCAGNGDLVRGLAAYESVAHDGKFTPILEYASDIAGSPLYLEMDAFDIGDVSADLDFFITNPPWSRDVLHPLIIHLCAMAPTWLLFDADWMHTKQAGPYLKYCRKIVSVGRVKWIADSPHTGKDNACWYLFDSNPKTSPPEFFPQETVVVL